MQCRGVIVYEPLYRSLELNLHGIVFIMERWVNTVAVAGDAAHHTLVVCKRRLCINCATLYAHYGAGIPLGAARDETDGVVSLTAVD